ncbi:MAG: hypothetical protein AB7G44_07140 [Bacteroidia bacterium]
MQIKTMVIETLKERGFQHLFCQKKYNTYYRKMKKGGNRYYMAMYIADCILLNSKV